MERKNTCVEVFGKRLKELRKANGYTIEQFADMVGISKSTLGYYENDKRMPDIEILARIANVPGRMGGACNRTGASTGMLFTDYAFRASISL